MSMDRRGFLTAGSIAAAAAGAPLMPAHAASRHSATSIEELGVVPNLGRDQTSALQKAIDTIAVANQAVILPGGAYTAGTLKLPSNCTLLGQPGLTVLTVGKVVASGGSTVISGVRFEQDAAGGDAFLSLDSGMTRLSDCAISGDAAAGLKIVSASVNLQGIYVQGFGQGAVVDLTASGGMGLTMSDCQFLNCGTGIAASIAPLTISQCQFQNCAIGIAATGSGIISGNIVTRAKSFGLKLGSAKGSGHILAKGNLLRDCRIGIGVAASGDDIVASLNLITGAKDGSIRAFDGERLVGPDLSRQSAEAYLNLMIAGNVAR